MATVNIKRCDVTGTSIGVKSYRVRLEEVELIAGPDCGVEIDSVNVIKDTVIDLGPRAFDRLANFIVRGTSSTKGYIRQKNESIAIEAADGCGEPARA